jgi:hypothetical protein
MTLHDDVKNAWKRGRASVAQLLAEIGERFDLDISIEVASALSFYPSDNLFHKCASEAAIWAGFVKPEDPDWRQGAIAYLETGAPHHVAQYRKGHRAASNPIAYLDSWSVVLNHPNVPVAPTKRTTSAELVRFYQDSFSALKQAEWRKDRHWLGPWTFLGAFKIYLLHESRLWLDPAIDAIVLPMGGREDLGYSFEHGWSALTKLGIVTGLPAGDDFDRKLAASQQAHAEVQSLAGAAGTRALHLNSGIYVLGSSHPSSEFDLNA